MLFLFASVSLSLCASLLQGTVCTDKIKELAGGLPLTIANAIIDGDDPAQIAQDCINAINDILGYIMPLCDQN